MNQQIENLIEQVTSYQWIPGQGTLVDFDKEKFAELIVRGCADYITEYYDCRDEAYYMKKHFGVEE
jgi:hypothetical protein